MTTVDRVKAAKNPQHALLEIAYALDRLMEMAAPPKWGEWGEPAPQTDENEWSEKPQAMKAAIEILDKGDETIVELPPADKGLQAKRADFARNSLSLDEAFDDIDGVDAYAKGGAYWLYTYDRDLVMSYPMEVRKQLVDDVMDTDEEAAVVVARDILKDPSAGSLPSVL